MLKKLLSLSLAAVILSVTAFATTGVSDMYASYAEGAPVFTYADSSITKITEADGTEHIASLTAWNGSKATEAPELVDGYYQIEDGADLAWFAVHVNTKDESSAYPNAAANAALVKDINLNSKSWRNFRIGNGGSFKGIFDGQGHIIYNLYQTGTYQGETGGLFHTIAGGTVKNLHFVNAHINSNYGDYNNLSYNAVVARSMSSGTIKNVTVSGKLTVSDGKYANGSGSIVGDLTGGTIEDCYSNATMDYSNCGTAVQAVYTYANGNQGVGGLVGCIRGSKAITIQRCGYGGVINAPFSSRTGGIVGSIKEANSNITLTNCYNTANITGNALSGGIVGWRTAGYDTIGTGLYNTGKITVNADSHASGIANAVGRNYAYSTGDVVYNNAGTETCGSKTVLLYGAIEPSLTKYNYENMAFCNENTYVSGEGEEAVTKVKPTFYLGSSKFNTQSSKGFTMAQFKDGTALATLGDAFVSDIGINNGLPILTWQAETPVTVAHEYEISASKGLTLTLEEAGYVALDITPLAGSATVTVDGDSKTITTAGTYYFKADSATAAVSVNGRAIVKEDVTAQTSGAVLETLAAVPIKATLSSANDATIVLALFSGDTLEKVEYLTNVASVDGKVTGVIDLTEAVVTGCTLKAYLWADGTLAPLTEAPETLN